MWHTRGVDSELDLNIVSRETLLALIAEQQVVIGGARGGHRRVATADWVLGIPSEPPRATGMPGNKPSSGQQAPEIKGALKTRAPWLRP